ncbi:MAG: AAA family ATPase [Betaproteobacteria bacterium]|nr:AAA family ATPase [Betaproteobacteria bacterium]
MITKLTLSNFKSIVEQAYEFTDFDLLVGRNNSGKSTILQALAIWQFCVDEFHRAKRSGSTGIQIVLPNFTALPVPEFNLLWKNRTDREYPTENGAKKQKFILIAIVVEWRDRAGQTQEFGIELRYHSPQTIYAIPAGGWAAFREFENAGHLPRVAYVPPFSGLEPTERWLDTGPRRQQVGKGQPGSVLRNLLLRVFRPEEKQDKRSGTTKGRNGPADWLELTSLVKRWFSVDLLPPQYDSAKDVHIVVEYRQAGKTYDLIAGGSGFHQTMTLLAFLYGYRPTTILLDEPDAHLHVNLQREILDYFKRKSSERSIQFLIATHAEEFAKGVSASQIVSLLSQVPTRVRSTPQVLRAMAEVSNEEIAQLMASPFILYLEGQSDERIVRAWAEACSALPVMERIFFKAMGGGGKQEMKRLADEHFAALREIIPGVKRLILFDYDSADRAFHPPADNPSLVEWRRANIENYLMVPAAWKRVALQVLQCPEDDLFAQAVLRTIDTFFSEQNLALPPGRTWRNVSANIFSVVDGKGILFENDDSLFHTLRQGTPAAEILRERVAGSMTGDEIHEDVHEFFAKLKAAFNAPSDSAENHAPTP